MSRKPHQAVEPTVIPGAVPAAHAIALTSEQSVKAIEQDQFSMAMQDIGSMRALDFVRQMSSRVQVEIYLRQKKTKAYMSVPHPCGGHFSSLDDFCETYLGESGRNIRRKVDNYHLLGSDLLEVSERLGFKGKDYTLLKALPADDQDIIKQAMGAETDRDQVIDLLQEMAVRHASEKAALKAQTTEAEETAAARDDVIKAKEATISRLELRATSAERRQADFTDIEARGYECAPLHDSINEMMVALAKMATEVKRLVEEVGGELVTEECFHAVLLPIKRSLEIAAHNRLHINLATLTDGQYDAPLEDIQARAAGLTPGALQ